jgi:hypothetical protein
MAAGDPEAFWDLLWLLTEEETRKLQPEQRDRVQAALTDHDLGAIEVLQRDKDDILVRIAGTVFALPVCTTSRAWQAPEPLADPSGSS